MLAPMGIYKEKKFLAPRMQRQEMLCGEMLRCPYYIIGGEMKNEETKKRSSAAGGKANEE